MLMYHRKQEAGMNSLPVQPPVNFKMIAFIYFVNFPFLPVRFANMEGLKIAKLFGPLFS